MKIIPIVGCWLLGAAIVWHGHLLVGVATFCISAMLVNKLTEDRNHG